jgi:ATP-dependent Clp protease ATP-binding subunit ClpC
MNPEFLNRLDEIIVFHPLTREDLRQIVGIMIEDITKRLNEKTIKLNLTEGARDLLIEQGYDPIYGARPLRRAIQKLLEDPLAEKILTGSITADKTVEVDRDNNSLIFSAK